MPTSKNHISAWLIAFANKIALCTHVQRANVSRYHLFLQDKSYISCFCNGKSRNRLRTQPCLHSVCASFAVERRQELNSPDNRFPASAIQFESYLPRPLSRTAFQPMGRPLFWRTARTPLSQHLFLMFPILANGRGFVKHKSSAGRFPL